MTVHRASVLTHLVVILAFAAAGFCLVLGLLGDRTWFIVGGPLALVAAYTGPVNLRYRRRRRAL